MPPKKDSKKVKAPAKNVGTGISARPLQKKRNSSEGASNESPVKNRSVESENPIQSSLVSASPSPSPSTTTATTPTTAATTSNVATHSSKNDFNRNGSGRMSMECSVSGSPSTQGIHTNTPAPSTSITSAPKKVEDEKAGNMDGEGAEKRQEEREEEVVQEENREVHEPILEKNSTKETDNTDEMQPTTESEPISSPKSVAEPEPEEPKEEIVSNEKDSQKHPEGVEEEDATKSPWLATIVSSVQKIMDQKKVSFVDESSERTGVAPRLSAKAHSAVARFQHALLPNARTARTPPDSACVSPDCSSQYQQHGAGNPVKNPRISKTIRKAASPPQPWTAGDSVGIDDVAQLVTPPSSTREARPALTDEPLNPFHYNSDVSQTLFQRVKRTIVGSFTFPFRTFHFLFCLVMAYVMSHITILGIERDFRLKYPIQRNFLRRFIYFFVRIGMTALGYYTVNRVHPENYGRLPDGSKAPHLAPIIVTNHCTLQDVFFLLGEHGAAFVGKREITQLPFIYGIGLAQQVVEVDRDDHDSRGAVVSEMTRRARWTDEEYEKHGAWRPSVIFPEGTCTNCSALIQFKAGAFTSGAPVQPVLLRYPYTYYDQSWCGVESPVHIFVGMLSQFYNRMEVEYLPMYVPSEEERHDANLYAENVRQVMAKALGVPTTEHNYFDVKLNVLAYKMGLPMDRVNVECGNPHFSAIKYPRMQHQLGVFAGLLYARSDAGEKYTKRIPAEGIMAYRYALWKKRRAWSAIVQSQQQQPSRPLLPVAATAHLSSPILRRYDYVMNTAYVEEGFMSARELEDFLSLQRFPSLLVCVLSHLSRHEPDVQLSVSQVANRGIAISFRSFLSAFTTEEVSYLDALPARDAAAIVAHNNASDALNSGSAAATGGGGGTGRSLFSLLTAGLHHHGSSTAAAASSSHHKNTSASASPNKDDVDSPNFKDPTEISTPHWLAPFVHTFLAEDVAIPDESGASAHDHHQQQQQQKQKLQQLSVLARRTLLMLAAAAAKCHLDRIHAEEEEEELGEEEGENDRETLENKENETADSVNPRHPCRTTSRGEGAVEGGKAKNKKKKNRTSANQEDANRYVSAWNACNHALDDVFAGYRTFRNGLEMEGEYDCMADEEKKEKQTKPETVSPKKEGAGGETPSTTKMIMMMETSDELGVSRDDFTRFLCPQLLFPRPAQLENEILKSALKKRSDNNTNASGTAASHHVELSPLEKELHGAYQALFDAMIDLKGMNRNGSDSNMDSITAMSASSPPSPAVVTSHPRNSKNSKDVLLCSDVDSFLPFAVTHRGLLLYLYATCEHYLMGDDLS